MEIKSDSILLRDAHGVLVQLPISGQMDRAFAAETVGSVDFRSRL